MNIPLTKQQVKELPFGLTNTIGPNRRQRKQAYQKNAFIKPSKNHPLVITQTSALGFSKFLRVSQVVDKQYSRDSEGKIIGFIKTKPKTVYHYKAVK